jgi:hypothetical protein
MASDAEFQNVLLRIISIRGRDCVENLLLGEYEVVKSGAGKLISTSVGGKSFSFQIPSGLNQDSIMIHADAALRTWDSLDDTQRDLLFTTRKQTRTRAVF